MDISAKKQLTVTSRALLFIGMLLLSLFGLAHALTIESIIIVKGNSAEHSTLTPGSATITADGTSTQVLTVTVKDANGNNMASGGADVAITKSSGTGSIGSVTDNGNGTYSARVTSPRTAGSGVFVATLAGAPVKGGTDAQAEATITYSAGRATKVVLITQPEGAVSGTALSTQPVVQLQDANGNNVRTSGVFVVAAITTGSGILTNATATTNSSGTATFTDLSIAGTAGNFVLTFTPTDLVAAISNPFALTAGSAAQIAVYAGDNQAGTVGSVVATAPSVKVKDTNNNPVSGVDVTFANGTGGSVSGTMTATTGSDGIATFAGTWRRGNTAGSNTLTATSTGLSGSPLTFTATGTAGAASQIAIETAADGSGSAITAQSLVSGTTFTGYAISRDALNNVVANVAATWSLTGITGGVVSSDLVAAGNGKSALFTAHLTGSATVQAASGSLIDEAGVITVTNGSASKLAFTTQPSASTVSGAAFAQQPVVAVHDAAGNTVTDATDLITLTLTTGTGTLGGTLAMNAVNGVADFTGKGVNIDLAGTDKVLMASSGILTTATTNPAFTITLPVVNIAAIPGVTVPVKGETPVTTITETEQYTGTVSWDLTPTGTIFGPYTSYTATITLFPKPGFTLAGVAANFFTVAGATSVTNSTDSGVVTALFPSTAQVDIGESFGGGKVFYIEGSKQHGLIAATADQSTGISWATPLYLLTSVPSGAAGTGIGTGKANTDAIISQNGQGSDFAAGIAKAYGGGGYTDWFLPSKDELNELYMQNNVVGGFAGDYYWSSTEVGAGGACWEAFYNGNQLQGNKALDGRVRAVRAF